MVSASPWSAVEIEHINVVMLEFGAEEQFVQTTVGFTGALQRAPITHGSPPRHSKCHASHHANSVLPGNSGGGIRRERPTASQVIVVRRDEASAAFT